MTSRITIELDWDSEQDRARIEGAIFGADAVASCLELEQWLEEQLSPATERPEDQRVVLEECLTQLHTIMRRKRPAAAAARRRRKTAAQSPG